MKFKDIFDFVENVDLRTINKKTLEALALSGGLDCLNSGCRRQYLYVEKDFCSIFCRDVFCRGGGCRRGSADRVL